MWQCLRLKHAMRVPVFWQRYMLSRETLTVFKDTFNIGTVKVMSKTFFFLNERQNNAKCSVISVVRCDSRKKRGEHSWFPRSANHLLLIPQHIPATLNPLFAVLQEISILLFCNVKSIITHCLRLTCRGYLPSPLHASHLIPISSLLLGVSFYSFVTSLEIIKKQLFEKGDDSCFTAGVFPYSIGLGWW